MKFGRWTHSEHVSDAKLDRLRKDFLSKHRDYEPYPANSPSNAVDRFINSARTSISRDLMQQQLDEAAGLLDAMLLRPAAPIQSQAVAAAQRKRYISLRIHNTREKTQNLVRFENDENHGNSKPANS